MGKSQFAGDATLTLHVVEFMSADFWILSLVRGSM